MRSLQYRNPLKGNRFHFLSAQTSPLALKGQSCLKLCKQRLTPQSLQEQWLRTAHYKPPIENPSLAANQSALFKKRIIRTSTLTNNYVEFLIPQMLAILTGNRAMELAEHSVLPPPSGNSVFVLCKPHCLPLKPRQQQHSCL